MKQNTHELGKLSRSLVTAELQRRGYTVEAVKSHFNVTSPSGQSFTVTVTSLSKPNAWIVRSVEDSRNYFILVFNKHGAAPEFCILNQEQMSREKESHRMSRCKPYEEYSNPELEKRGLGFKQPFGTDYLNKWQNLPK